MGNITLRLRKSSLETKLGKLLAQVILVHRQIEKIEHEIWKGKPMETEKTEQKNEIVTREFLLERAMVLAKQLKPQKSRCYTFINRSDELLLVDTSLTQPLDESIYTLAGNRIEMGIGESLWSVIADALCFAFCPKTDDKTESRDETQEVPEDE